MGVPRWQKLDDKALQGANFALRVVHTSPLVRGVALEMLRELITETYEEMQVRPGLRLPSKPKPSKR